MPKRNQSLPTPPNADDEGKEDRKNPSLPSIMDCDIEKNVAAALPVVPGPTTFAMESAASSHANSAAASASSTGARTRVAEGPEVYPPTEPAPVHSANEKNPPSRTSDVARLPQATTNELLRHRETETTCTRLGRDVSVQTFEVSYTNGSRSVAAETTDAATRKITLEVTEYPSQMDTEEDKVVGDASQDASVLGDSRIAVSAAPEVYPPTPRQGSLDDADVHANDQKMQRKLAKASTAEIPPCPEEVPIEDPRECHDHADESRVLRTGNKRRNRATKGAVTNTNEIRSQAEDDQASSAETDDVTDIFSGEPTSGQSSPALQITPGAVAVSGTTSNDDDMEFENHEGPSQGTPQDSDVEAAEDSQEATLQVTGVVVNNRGQHVGTTRNTPTEVPLVSAEVVPDANVPSCKCSSREYSRRTWAKVALFVAVIVAAVSLMGVLIPQESTEVTQEGVQGSQLGAAPSSTPTSLPSLLPSLTPTFDPETLRFRAIQSILVPISGLEVLFDTSTPQYRALEWISHVDPLQLPHNTEAERKRVVQRYLLAVLYYASGGKHWINNNLFLEGIHECFWWSWYESGGKVGAQGASCTKGLEVGVVDYLIVAYNNLTGTLPSELQYLVDLVHLDISGNFNFGGPIPGFNGNMTSLTHLFMNGNMHTGTIPSSLGCLSNLEALELSGNGLTGTIPESFGKLTSLRYLDLPYNMLNGTIPSALGQLSNLEGLSLGGNDLTGSISESFGNFTNLKWLSLSSNMLNGTIPSVLGQLSGLRYLILDRNHLTGEIPNEICRRKESGGLVLGVDTLTANGTEFLCECIPVEGLSGCCVVRPNKVGDGSCEGDEPYNTAACGWDGGDCLVEGLPECLGAKPSRIGNGDCNDYEPYNTAACGWDGEDCLAEGLAECLGVNPSRIGDGHCYYYDPYNTEVCGYDGGDCCESTCEGLHCGQNGYYCIDPNPTVNVTCSDQNGLEGCCIKYPSHIGDGYCHPYAPYNTKECKYDNGDCPAACPEGTSPVAGKNMSACCVEGPSYVGDGYCNNFEPYNTAACSWDGGDCCEETCEGSWCGKHGYDCKDPTISNI